MMAGPVVFYFLSLVFFPLVRRKWKTGAVLENPLLLTGWIWHGYVILRRSLEARRAPLTDTYETLIVFAWLIVMVSFYAAIRLGAPRVKRLGVIAALCLSVFSLFLNDAIRPLMPSLRSGWLYVHVVAYLIAYASFAVAFGLSVVFFAVLWRRRDQRDTLDSLEGMIFQVIDMGFPCLTLGLACGSVWASISWGRFWNWDAKEVWALTTWLIYVGCLHLRHTRNLRGWHAAALAGIGFIAVFFTYIGVNVFFTTLHSYA